MTKKRIDFKLLEQHPLLIVISGPSGVGKDAILKELMTRELPLHFVITATSRKPRADEMNGEDYFFLSVEEFEGMIADGDFIEHALVYDQYKGIPRSQVIQAFSSGLDVILRVDVQGAVKLRELFPEALLIFVVPSNEEEWYHRLLTRKTETPEQLHLRVITAQEEIAQLGVFDYIVINAEDRLAEAVDVIIAIIEAEHHKIKPRKVSL
ncbi:MAG: guanylate kinase [Anaerolineae bacterium]|nr:guanylate kinase [Anaerolineae bacterium]